MPPSGAGVTKCPAHPRRYPTVSRILPPRWVRTVACRWGQTRVSGSSQPPCGSSLGIPSRRPSIAVQALIPPGRRGAPDGHHIALDPRDIQAKLHPWCLEGWQALVSVSPLPLGLASPTPGCEEGAASVFTSVTPPHPAVMLKVATTPLVPAAPASQAPLSSHPCCPHGGTGDKGRGDPLQDGGDLARPATLQCWWPGAASYMTLTSPRCLTIHHRNVLTC